MPSPAYVALLVVLALGGGWVSGRRAPGRFLRRGLVAGFLLALVGLAIGASRGGPPDWGRALTTLAFFVGWAVVAEGVARHYRGRPADGEP
jgi:hydrogenase/urease accessory protein HupE